VDRILDESLKNRLYAPDYICLLCTFIGPDSSSTTAAMISMPEDSKRYLSIEETNEQLIMHFNLELLEWMYESGRAHREKIKREKSIKSLDSVILGSSEKKEVTPITIDTNLFAVSMVATRLIGNTTEVLNEASSVQSTTTEMAYDLALRLARLRWPILEGWQHTISVQEIKFHLTLSHTNIQAKKTISHESIRPQHRRKVRKKKRKTS